MPVLEARDIVKDFPGVRALKGVNLTADAGEVVALLGENGAGKSTLMKILAGVQAPTSGQLLVDGEPIEVDSCRKAMELGIVLIHQELNLATNLSVGANIYLGREPRKRGFIDRKAIEKGSRDVLAQVGLHVDPKTKVGDLTIGRQQLVEIAKALSINARVLIMDEPTSSLSQKEAENLFVVVKDLRKRGVGVIYISHRLGEVRELADRVIVFRDGENAGVLSRSEVTHDNMVRMMVGRDISEFYERKPKTPGKVLLEVNNLRTPAHPAHKLSFKAHAGEIVGIAGLVGAGRTEMLRTLFGVDQAIAGEIQVGGERIEMLSPKRAIEAGLALVPEDRKMEGLVLPMNVRQNVSLASLRYNHDKGGRLNTDYERDLSKEMIDKLKIKTPDSEQVTNFLSGGNQQKVVIGKWLALRPKVLLLDEPTRGIDVGSKHQIYKLMEDLAETGIAVVFVSSEMEEILNMSDRALVMHEGGISGELSREELSEEAVMYLATGHRKAS